MLWNAAYNPEDMLDEVGIPEATFEMDHAFDVDDLAQNLYLVLGAQEESSRNGEGNSLEEVERLETKLWAALSEVSRLKNNHASIHRLPPEILSAIFNQLQPPLDDSYPPFPLPKHFKRWIVVAGVCRYWREVVSATPSLWSTVRFRSINDPTTQLALYTGNSPLRIFYSTHSRTRSDKIDGAISEAAIRAINEQAHRLQELHISTDLDTRGGVQSLVTLSRLIHPVSNLEALSLIDTSKRDARADDISQLFGGSTPNLRRLILANMGGWLNSGLSKALTHLHVFNQDLVASYDSAHQALSASTKYIKGMLSNPDIAPSASINRWIVSILLFHFDLVHIPGTHHGPDGLSRRPPQPADKPEPDDDFDDWVDQMHGFMHMINSPTRNTLDTPPVSIFIASTNSEHFSEAPSRSPSPDREDSPSTSPDSDPDSPFDYSVIPRPTQGSQADDRLLLVRQFHDTLQRPQGLSDSSYETFLRYCTEFFVSSDRLWRKDPKGEHKLVVPPSRRLFIIISAHDEAGHHGFYATNSLISTRYWWPLMGFDISWFIRTCDLCQRRNHRKILIPPIVATPAPIFAKIYVDTMHLPSSSGFKYIVQGRCSLTHWVEFEMLRKENARSIGDWLLKSFIWRWGTLVEIVTDNGKPFVKALTYLDAKYHVKHVRISGYNSRANGLIERSHFDVRQALYKAADGDQSRWASTAYSVFWADRISIRRRMGCSPYFAVTGTQPLLPFDIAEANYLLPPPDSILSTTDLISRRAIALQKRREHLSELHSDVYASRIKAARRFEEDHALTIRDYNFKLGSLVLVRNTIIEKSLNRKMRARYLGPLIVISRNKGGAYILAELNGSLLHRPIAAFRVIPYFARQHIPLPPLDELLDVSTARLRELEDSTSLDPEDDADLESDPTD